MSVAARVIGDLRVGALVVLAARDMAAERCRAAVLDRRHHLELAETDVAGIGLTPCRSLAAENIRDLQHRTGHRRRWLRRQRVFPLLSGLLARLRQEIERALDARDHTGRDAGVARRRI